MSNKPTDYSWFERTIEEKKRYRFCGTEHYKYWHYIQQGMIEREYGIPVRDFFQLTQEFDENDVYEGIGKHAMNPGLKSGVTEVEDFFDVKLPMAMHDFYRRWGGGYLMLGEFHYLLSPAEMVRISAQFREPMA